MQQAAPLRGAVPHSKTLMTSTGAVKAVSGWSKILSYNDVVADLEFFTTNTSQHVVYDLTKFRGLFDATKIQFINVEIYERRFCHDTKTQSHNIRAIVGDNLDTTPESGTIVQIGGISHEAWSDGASSHVRTTNKMIPIFPGATQIRLDGIVSGDTEGLQTKVTFKAVWTLTSELGVPKSNSIYISGSRDHTTMVASKGYVDASGVRDINGVSATNHTIGYGTLYTSEDDLEHANWSDFLPLIIPSNIRRTRIRSQTSTGNNGSSSEEAVKYILDLHWDTGKGVLHTYMNYDGYSHAYQTHNFNIVDGFEYNMQLFEAGELYKIIGEFGNRTIIKLPWFTCGSSEFYQASFEIENFEDMVVAQIVNVDGGALVEELPSEPKMYVTYRLTTEDRDHNAPPGLYQYIGDWICVSCDNTYALDGWGGVVDDVLIPGVAYKVLVVTDVTALSLTMTREGATTILIDNGDAFILPNPTTGFTTGTDALEDMEDMYLRLSIQRDGDEYEYMATGRYPI